MFQEQRKGRQRSRMAVVAAFMGDAFSLGPIGQGQGLRDGQGVHIRSESDGRLPVTHSWFVQCAEPVSLVDYLQICMFPDEIHQAFFCLSFLSGQFRMGVEGMAQSNDLFPVQLG